MGVRYSLCAVVRREATSSLLFELSRLLDDDSRERIEHLVWAPETEVQRRTLIGITETDARGIAGLKPGSYEAANVYCFSLLVEQESFGCLWTSICAGNEYLLLEMQAANSGLSSEVRDSKIIHKMWLFLRLHSCELPGGFLNQQQL